MKPEATAGSTILLGKYAIDSKNKLLQLVHGIREAATFPGAINLATDLLTVLSYTHGVWVAARYGYKAREIAELAIDAVDERLQAYGKKNQRAEDIRAALVALSVEIYKAHMETFYGE